MEASSEASWSSDLSTAPFRVRPRRRCQDVALECTPKLCVVCKAQNRPERFVYECRERLGHVAPNWDAPDASVYFDAEPSVAAAAARAAAESVVPAYGGRKRRAVAPPEAAAARPPPPAKKRRPPNAVPTGAMSDFSPTPGAGAPAARGDFGLGKPLVFGRIERLDAGDPATANRAAELRRSGTPCVLFNVDPRTLTPFAGRWLRKNGTLDEAALLADVGGERAPILRYDGAYSDARPIRESMAARDFLRDHWRSGDGGAYLHQWQYPLASPACAARLTRSGDGTPFAAPPLPGLGPDILEHWLERTRGASALQYLFMGGAGTRSKLHVDPGGLDLVIAPLVGIKEVTLVHRDDAELVGAVLC